jgi:hypothetical protein
MDGQSFFNDYYQIFSAIDYCISEKLHAPALVLIYSAMDSTSWAACEDEKQHSGKKYFTNWVDKWMLRKYPLSCSSLELYAARCAILHTLTPYSDLSKNHNIRIISYGWGNAKQEDLEETINRLYYPNNVSVHLNNLLNSFKNGFKDFMEYLDTNQTNKELFFKKANMHYVNVDKSVIHDFLQSTSK